MTDDKPPRRPLRPDQHTKPWISDRHCELMGEAIANWARLEVNLDILIWLLVKMSDEDGRILTPRIDANQKIQILRVLSRMNATELFESLKFNELLNKIDELRDDRNFLVRGTWCTLMPDNEPFGSSLRQKAEPGMISSETFPEARMNEIIQNIKLSIQYLRGFTEAIVASRDK
jgi:hypothetical protein